MGYSQTQIARILLLKEAEDAKRKADEQAALDAQATREANARAVAQGGAFGNPAPAPEPRRRE